MNWFKQKQKNTLMQWLSARGVQCKIQQPKILLLPGMEPLRCFKNVLDYVDKHPTKWEACWGWSIMPSFHKCDLFGLEAHVVLKNLDNDLLVDITPDLLEPGRTKLFVADPLVQLDIMHDSKNRGHKIGTCERCERDHVCALQ